MASIRCPPALESDSGTVNQDAITITEERMVIDQPTTGLFPSLRERANTAPVGTNINGIQNNNAALSSSSMVHLRLVRLKKIVHSSARSVAVIESGVFGMPKYRTLVGCSLRVLEWSRCQDK
jgi:hypothetical protein